MRTEAVKKLISRHEDRANYHALAHQHHTKIINELKNYLYELQKPGFKTKGWTRYTRQGRTENYVLLAEHGQRQGDDRVDYGKAATGRDTGRQTKG